MSYEPTNWKTGDVVTSAKLNKLENAVANGGVMVVTFTKDGYDDQQQKPIVTADVSFEDVYQAASNGKLIVFVDNVYYYGSAIAVFGEDFIANVMSFGNGDGNTYVRGSIIEYSPEGIIVEEMTT